MVLNINELEKLVQNKMVITGGHFRIDDKLNPILNSGTIDSLKNAAQTYLFGRNQGYQVGLGILINDIGLECDGRESCVVIPRELSNESYSLPKEYLDILSNLEINLEEVDIYWERHLRNRGHKLLRKEIRKKNSLIEVINGDHWLTRNLSDRILLSRYRRLDPYGNSACPLIMAAFAFEQQRRGFESSLNFYYTEWDNLPNIPDPFVISKGNSVAEFFGCNLKIKNLFSGEHHA